MARKKTSPVAVSLVILVLLAVGVVWLSGFYTDFLWFNQLGYSTVFTTQVWAKLAAFGVGFLIAGAAVFAVMWFAGRKRPIYARQTNSPLDAYRQLVDRSRKFWLIVLPAIAGLVGGSYAAGKWQIAAMFLNHTYT